MLAISRRVVSLLAVPLLLTVSPVIADDKRSAEELSDYELMSVFVEAFEQIETNYVRDVDRRELLEAAVKGMVSHLDQYSNFIPPRRVTQFNQMVEQEFGGIGIQVNSLNGRLIVVSPLPETPAYRAGIQPGDIIVEVEGKSMRGTSLSDAVVQLQGPVGRPVTIKVLHSGERKPEEITLIRQLIKSPTVRGDRYKEDATWDYMLPGEPRIAYIRVSNFGRYTDTELRKAVQQSQDADMQGLVIDMRNNPGGLLDVAIKMCDMFLEEGNIVSVKGRNVAERSWDAKKNGAFPDFPMAVLVNNFSASASEVFSACMQDNKRAVVVGERSWGKGSVQNVIRMEQGDSALKLTTASYHRPSGVNIHRFPDMTPEDKWGVTPDDGFLIKLSRDERIAINRQRSGRDVLHQHVEKKAEESPKAPAKQEETDTDDKSTIDDESTEDGDESTDSDGDQAADEAVVDRQLQAAIDYIRNQIDGPQVADATTTDAPDKDQAEPKKDATPESTEPSSQKDEE